MGVTVTRTFAPLTEAITLTQEDWLAAGQLLRERIIRRTRQGRDMHEVPFAPYSAKYLLAKDKAAGAFDAGGYADVTLTLSGAMLNGIQVVAYDDRVELTF